MRAVALSRAAARHAPCADTGDYPTAREGAAFADTGGYPKRVTAAHHRRSGVSYTCSRPTRMTAPLYTGALHGALLSRRDGFTRALYTPLTTHGARPKFSKIFRVLTPL